MCWLKGCALPLLFLETVELQQTIVPHELPLILGCLVIIWPCTQGTRSACSPISGQATDELGHRSASEGPDEYGSSSYWDTLGQS